MEKKEEEIHVLIVAFSAQGHLNLMLRLAKRLLSKGLQVTLATTEVALHRMFSSSSATATANSTAGIHLKLFSDGWTITTAKTSTTSSVPLEESNLKIHPPISIPLNLHFFGFPNSKPTKIHISELVHTRNWKKCFHEILRINLEDKS
ncbi:indole-3-acetate beta-glucosyltransferase [Sarracenia purpurea var. burkii]